jgi:hypothetical protein
MPLSPNPTPPAEPPAPEGADGLILTPRSPRLAAVYSALLLGSGQVHNHQLDKAVLFWLWGAVHLGAGLLLLLLGLLGRWVPRGWPRPPLGDLVADHSGWVLLTWLAAGMSLWLLNVRDAARSAHAINRGEVRIRYSMRRQLAHVLGSQLLGLLPGIGFLFPPGLVAEGLDAARERRRLDSTRLLAEGRQALIEWAAVRVALWSLAGFTAFWLGWWVLRAFRLAP